MKNQLLFLLLLFAFTSSAQTTKSLDSIVSYFDRNHLFHGTVLVAKNGKVLLHRGYGLADAKSKKATDTSTVFQIGSVTKQFTAAAILKLAEEGKLSVHDTIRTFFPEMTHAGRITIHHLLTHTSGLYNYTNDTGFMNAGAKNASTHLKMMALFANRDLDFEPGSRYSYSNSGYILLGYIIEKVSGMPYEQYIRRNIFQPLGMKASGFDFARAGNRATGYFDNGTEQQPSFVVDSTGSFSAGAIYSTTGDLYKWVQAVHAQKILQPSSWRAAFTPFKANYGYGWVVAKKYASEWRTHNGGIHGFVSHLSYLPDSNMVVILLSNYMLSDLTKLSNALHAALFGKTVELPKIRTQIHLPADSLKQYTGEYQLAPQFSIRIFLQNDQLMAQATGQGAAGIYPERTDLFFYKIVDAQIEFNKDETGKVTGLVLYQNGMKLPGNKIQ